jgi:hypothetical protein
LPLLLRRFVLVPILGGKLQHYPPAQSQRNQQATESESHFPITLSVLILPPCRICSHILQGTILDRQERMDTRHFCLMVRAVRGL